MAKSITLAGEELEVAVPDDLDARLLVLAGITAAEMRKQLAGLCIAGTIAKALAPLLVGCAKPRHEIASAIAKDGADEVRRAVLELYGGAVAAPAKKRSSSKPPKPPEPSKPELTIAIYCDRYIAGEGRDDDDMLQFAVNNGEAIEAEFHKRNEAARAAKEASGGRKK